MTYRINHYAVSAYAAQEFGIIGPVFLRRVKRLRSSDGTAWTSHAQVETWFNVQPDAEYAYHRLAVVTDDRDPLDTAESIAHELEHIRQAEQIIRWTLDPGMVDAINAYLNPPNVSYLDRDCEIRAREAGRKHSRPIMERCFKIRP